MIEGGPIFTLELSGCGQDCCIAGCPCNCHDEFHGHIESQDVPTTVTDKIRLITQEGIEYRGVLVENPDRDVGVIGETNVDRVELSLRDLIKKYPLTSRPHFETRRRRRVPKMCMCPLTILTHSHTRLRLL
eukprot:Blabericola_migrator_1__10010@NODE_5544_length_736_cov_71_967115_g3597_i0_p1_GENE_NODE_5544_length_736_cov_71_967115_g3597_i0NODE_5544_length_736_cov_71_967115_g3597_i0_p1_ORF_typecomplete_len131_score27_06_NODE_5544_length_736_cov_71_967115_g3597_i050442